jgi:acyl-coenzyme A thioesterase PaaI-like protein
VTAPPPQGFAELESRSPFVNRAGQFFIREAADGSRKVGTWVGEDQANSEGFAHGGFLLTFADFALTIITVGITLNMTADFLRPARVSDWIEMDVQIRKSSSSLIFADGIVTGNGQALMRVGGLFKPFEKRS